MRKLLLFVLLFASTVYAEQSLQEQLTKEKITTEIELERLKKAKIQEEYLKIQANNDKINQTQVNKEPYTFAPVTGKTIKISDRTIVMPETITVENSTEIVKKINFLNRKNNYPIFIVIDTCYGGSVLGGELILRTIENSKAKVYIVVKTFCASMCAIITSTFAENAYVMNNAMILHHEISSGVQGNISLQKENINYLEYWQKQMLGPIAKRRGQTVDEFVASLYKLSRTGDATLFAPDALKEKWILHIINNVEDGSFNVIVPGAEREIILKIKLQKKIPNDIMYVPRNMKITE